MAYETHGRCWAAHGPFGLTFSNVFGALVHLDLRFRMNLGPRALSIDACAAKSSTGEQGTTPFGWYLKESGPRAGTFKEGTGTFMPDTCHLYLVTCHLYLYT